MDVYLQYFIAILISGVLLGFFIVKNTIRSAEKKKEQNSEFDLNYAGIRRDVIVEKGDVEMNPVKAIKFAKIISEFNGYHADTTENNMLVFKNLPIEVAENLASQLNSIEIFAELK